MNKGQQPPVIPEIQLPTPPPGGGGGGDDDDKKNQGQSSSKMEAYRFDSAALERAAKAARDLEKSSKFFVIMEYVDLKELSWKINV